MLNYLNDNEIKQLKRKTLSKDEILYHQGDICNAVCIVEKGQIEIKSYTNSGKEIIYSVVNADELFGHNLLFSNNKQYKGDVVATKDSVLYKIDEQLFLSILQTNTNFLRAYLNFEANNMKSFNNKIKVLAIDSALDRFLFYLKSNNGQINYTSITALSKELSLTRETTSRLISKLVKDKVISNKNKQISFLLRTK